MPDLWSVIRLPVAAEEDQAVTGIGLVPKLVHDEGNSPALDRHPAGRCGDRSVAVSGHPPLVADGQRPAGRAVQSHGSGSSGTR